MTLRSHLLTLPRRPWPLPAGPRLGQGLPLGSQPPACYKVPAKPLPPDLNPPVAARDQARWVLRMIAPRDRVRLISRRGGWRGDCRLTEKLMVDLAAIAGLLVDLFGASKEWREPKVARFDPPDDAEKEEMVRNLKAKGHKLQWVPEHRLRQLTREG